MEQFQKNGCHVIDNPSIVEVHVKALPNKIMNNAL